MEHVDEQGAPGWQPPVDASPWRPPEQGPRPAPQGWSQEGPPQHPPAPWGAEPRTNPAAVWSWVLAVPCAVAGLVLGVLGLLRSRRRGGAGFAHAVVGTALSAVVLLVGTVVLAVGTAAGVASLVGDRSGPDGRSPDGTVTSLSAPEQAYIDDLYEETYQSFDDATLLEMAYGFCADLDAGLAPADADAALVSRWADEQLDLDAAYDVEWSATASLCQEHAEEFQAWDPSATDGADGTGTTTMVAADAP